MKRIVLLSVFVGFTNIVLWAQTGHYFLSHYKPGSDKYNYVSFDIHQDLNGILFFANRSGVLQFDGRTWNQIPSHGAVYTLTATASGELYAGGSSGFGKITHDESNQLAYHPLSDSLKNIHNVFDSHAEGEIVYFLSEIAVYKVTGGVKAEVIVSMSEKTGAFTGLHAIGTRILVDTENLGVMTLVNDRLQDPDILKGKHIVFSEPSHDAKSFFLGTDDNRYFVQREGAALQEHHPKDIDYLNANVVVNAAWVNDNMVALGTLRGGVVFVDLITSETNEITNFYTGLPDNEVFAIHTDRHYGVWIAHEYGFSRAAPFLPFRTYNHYPGLAGNLLCVQSFGDGLYVGTTLGLYKLIKQEIFEDETYEIMQTIVEKKKVVVEPPKEPEKTRRGFLGLGKIGFGKKKNQPAATKEEPKVSKGPAAKKRAKVQKTRKVLRGVEYQFTQVLGVSGKVDQLMIVGNKLLGGGVSGVFEVRDLVAFPLTPSPSRAIYYSENLNQVLVSTYDDEILSFKPAGRDWVDGHFPDSLSMYADYFFEDHVQNLWICGRDRVVRVGIEGREILDAETIPLPYTSIDKTVGLSYGQDVYLTQNGEFFHYLSYKNTFVKFDSLPGPKKYFASSGSFWFYDGHRWRTVDPRRQGELKTEWLALFPDIRFLAPAERGKSLWVITSSNELYKFSSEFSALTAESNPLFLKEVRNQQSQLSPKSLRVDENESALTFEFVQPEYVSLQAVEYHYWVKGLQDTWTDWSTVNNIINFPFLPPGEYSVMVESRDLFGKITKLDTINVNVLPPYWKRPEFYALEFLFFGVLVVLSLRLNVSTSRFQYLSQFLSTLTIVLLIQFVQTIVGANISMQSTPVADFFIQVVIALLVLPVENFLRKRMIRAAERTKR
ncbi:MAG: hypothetical protein JNK10_00750 [Cyclobacteriaceae bacterium]|nr:hypothetical protein [Cyclobacteriaceae bacterium]